MQHIIDQINAMTVKVIPVADLIPYERNTRTHTEQQIRLIVKSIMEHGWTNPILIADGGILAGHGRLMAAKKLGLAQVPCIDLSHLDEVQRRAYVIWDNRSAEYGSTWDIEMLRLEVTDLQAEGFDFADIGFSDDDLAELLGSEEVPKPEADPDAIPAPPDAAHTMPGDVWQLGPHRVMCGSSLELSCWETLMAGEKADICWTDPPYNVDIELKNRKIDRGDGYNRQRTGGIANDKMSAGEFFDFLHSAYASLFICLKDGAPIYVAHADKEAHAFRGAFEQVGFKFSSMLIWRKDSHVLGMADYHSMHEPIIYGWKPGSKHRWYGGRKLKTIVEYGDGGPIKQLEDGRWAITVGDSVLIVDGQATLQEVPGTVLFHPRPARSDLHPTSKPVGLVEKMLSASARSGDIVIDGFGGSGSTLIAADRLGMMARLMELDPRFVDVICQRYWDYTGRRPVHAKTGKPWGTDPVEPEPEPVSDLPPVDPANIPF